MEASRVFVIMDELGLGIVANIINHLLRIRSERISGTFRTTHRYVPDVPKYPSEPPGIRFRTGHNLFPNSIKYPLERTEIPFWTHPNTVWNVSKYPSEPVRTCYRTDYFFALYFMTTSTGFASSSNCAAMSLSGPFSSSFSYASTS